MTDYFRDDVLAKRTYIRMEWCEAAIAAPVRKEVQPEDGRIRHWIFVPEIGKFLRVVTLADGVTLKLNYDAATDSLYIHLTDTPATDSDEVVEGVVLDYAGDGALVGIDVQHASRKTDIHHLAISHLPLTELQAA